MSRTAASVVEHLRVVRPVRIALRVLLIGLAALVISGICHALFRPATNESIEAAQMVSSLTARDSVPAPVPEGFDSSLGYRPVAVAGRLLDPDGGCSTPGGIGPETFNTACRTHDLGYDVLRFSEIEGDRLGAWARFDLDLLLYEDMVRTCETTRCRATAAVYYTAVTANSIRQGYTAPTEEPAGPWLGLVVAVLGLALVPPLGVRGVMRLVHSLIQGGTRLLAGVSMADAH